MDTVRANLQNQRGFEHLKYKNTFDAIRKISVKEGMKGFYKGFGSVAFFTIPAHALYFLGYETSKKYLYPSLKEEEKGPIVKIQ